MGDAVEKAILKEVEKRLRGMFADGVTVTNITAETEAERYLAKAAMTTDPILPAGFEELAKERGANERSSRARSSPMPRQAGLSGPSRTPSKPHDQETPPGGRRVHAYRCGHCDMFHLGHEAACPPPPEEAFDVVQEEAEEANRRHRRRPPTRGNVLRISSERGDSRRDPGLPIPDSPEFHRPELERKLASIWRRDRSLKGDRP